MTKCSFVVWGFESYSIHFLVFNFSTWFLGGVKGRVEIPDFMKVFKMVVRLELGLFV